MNRKLSHFIPYVILLAVTFYILPVCITSEMFMLLILIPALIVVCSVVYGRNYGFNLLIPSITVILFVPTIFIFYNATADIYILIYAILSFLGNSVGRLFYKK